MSFKPSKFQQAVFDFIEKGNGSAVIEAVAGSGKSTTIVQSLRLIDSSKHCVFLAFNKSIADELKTKVPENVDCMTTHSLGFSALRGEFRNVNVNSNKILDILREMNEEGLMQDNDYKYSSGHVRRLVSLAKANGLVPEQFSGNSLMDDTTENWQYLIEEYGIQLGSPQMSDQMIARKTIDVIGWARTALLRSLKNVSSFDFDDQLYVPVVMNLNFKKYDFVFVDEAQDMSAIQRSILSKLMDKNSRLIAVGDSRQVLYQFRGASHDSLDQIRKTFNCITLPLSISYRCGSNIIAEAKAIVPQIEAAENAPAGLVETRSVVYSKEFQPGDFIICRAKAPLVKMAYKLISSKVPAYIMGREIGDGLVNLIRKMKANSMDELQDKLDRWREKEIKKLMAKDPQADLSPVEDKFECIDVFIDSCDPRTPDDLIRSIENLFSDGKDGCVTLSTIHKIKGKEADRVWFADADLLPSKRAKKPEDIQIEYNIKYVGQTRARSHLIYFNSQLITSGERPS